MTDWDRRFIDLAQHVSTWSKDPSTQVGAVIVDANRRVVSVGFNGFPRGVGDDERMADRATKYEMTVHAEVNALMFANRGVDGCTVYVWPIPPCARCAAQLIQAGIARVVSPPPTERWVESCSLGTAMLAEADVEIDQIAGVETIPDDAGLVDNSASPFRPPVFETVPPSLPTVGQMQLQHVGLTKRVVELEAQARLLGKQAEDRELLILQLRKQIERDAAQAALDDTKIRDQAVELAVLRGQVKERENRLTHIEMLRKHTKVLEQDHVAEQATLRKQVEAQRLLILDLRKQLDQSERVSTARQDDLRASNAMIHQQLTQINALQAETLKRDKQLLEMSGKFDAERKRGNSLQFMISARQQELERQNADLQVANNKLLDRARAAEGVIQKLERSHA